MAHINPMIGIVSQAITELENNIESHTEKIVVPNSAPNLSAGVPMLEKLKKHWLIAILIICVAVAGTTWKVAIELLVAPRDFLIMQLQDEVQRLKVVPPPARVTSTVESTLMLEQTGVSAGSSVTTKDGRCTVRIISVSESSIFLSVIVDSSKPVEYKNRRPGDRITIENSGLVYYIDLHRVRGNIVDIEIFSHTK